MEEEGREREMSASACWCCRRGHLFVSAPPSIRIPDPLTTKKENQARWKERMWGAAKLQSTTLSAFSDSVTAVVTCLTGSGLDMVK